MGQRTTCALKSCSDTSALIPGVSFPETTPQVRQSCPRVTVLRAHPRHEEACGSRRREVEGVDVRDVLGGASGPCGGLPQPKRKTSGARALPAWGQRRLDTGVLQTSASATHWMRRLPPGSGVDLNWEKPPPNSGTHRDGPGSTRFNKNQPRGRPKRPGSAVLRWHGSPRGASLPRGTVPAVALVPPIFVSHAMTNCHAVRTLSGSVTTPPPRTRCRTQRRFRKEEFTEWP